MRRKKKLRTIQWYLICLSITFARSDFSQSDISLLITIIHGFAVNLSQIPIASIYTPDWSRGNMVNDQTLLPLYVSRFSLVQRVSKAIQWTIKRKRKLNNSSPDIISILLRFSKQRGHFINRW